MSKNIVTMNGKTMTHKLLGFTGVVTGTGEFGAGTEVRLRYPSTNASCAPEMAEHWFPLREVEVKAAGAAKRGPKVAAGAKRGPAAGAKRGPRTKKAAVTS